MKSFLLVAFLVFTFCGVDAQRAGTLDKQFGDTGVVITNFPGYNNVFNRSLVLKDDNVIVSSTVGTSFEKPGLALTRYLPNGSVDASFGNQGSTKLLNGITSTGLAIQSDGKIVICGSYTSGTFAVERFLSSGSLDPSFATSGIFIDSASKRYLAATDIALQPDGKIVVCGINYYNENFDRASFLQRFTTGGKPDSSFGNNSFVAYYSSAHFSNTMTIQKDGKIITGGEDDDAGTFSLVRYTAEGKPDGTFGTNGEVLTSFDKEYENFITDLAIQSNGQIVAVGQVGYRPFYKPYMAVTCYNTNGSIDVNFGNAGKAFIKFEYASQANAVAIQQNGKIVVAGWVSNNDGNFAVARLNTTGLLDSSFGVNGTAVTDIGTTGDQALSAGLQSDGNIIVGGIEVAAGNIYNTVLASYYGDPIKHQSPIIKKIKRWIHNHTLNWQYNADADYFVIEQSSNGVNDFKEIAKVKNVNRQSLNVNDVYTYNLNDFANSQQLKANSKSYYRITAVSNNSKAASTVISDEDVISITISPNPVKDVMKISGLQANQKTTINIVNRNGTILQSAVCNSLVCSMNIAELKSGLYNVQVNVNGKTQTLKFVKE